MIIWWDINFGVSMMLCILPNAFLNSILLSFIKPENHHFTNNNNVFIQSANIYWSPLYVKQIIAPINAQNISKSRLKNIATDKR